MLNIGLGVDEMKPATIWGWIAIAFAAVSTASAADTPSFGHVEMVAPSDPRVQALFGESQVSLLRLDSRAFISQMKKASKNVLSEFKLRLTKQDIVVVRKVQVIGPPESPTYIGKIDENGSITVKGSDSIGSFLVIADRYEYYGIKVFDGLFRIEKVDTYNRPPQYPDNDEVYDPPSEPGNREKQKTKDYPSQYLDGMLSRVYQQYTQSLYLIN